MQNIALFSRANAWPFQPVFRFASRGPSRGDHHGLGARVDFKPTRTGKSRKPLQSGWHLMVRRTPNHPPTVLNDDYLVARYIS
jgi:hypothetical protein